MLACAAVARSQSPLVDAARDDDAARVVSLLAEGAEVDARDEDGATALAWAAIRCNVELAQKLLRARANPDVANGLGVGPLSLAIANGSTAMVRLLLEHGANPNVATENGETPLMTAARLGQVDVMRMLLGRKADPNAREARFGQTALMWAAGRPDAVRLLLAHGADPRVATRSWDVKYTIYAPTTVTLGRTGIPWNTDGDHTTRKGGQNALFFAVQKNDVESARMLLDAGLAVDSRAADGTTPLLASLYKWDPPNGVFVPGRGAPAVAGSSQKFGPDMAMARFLLERGASAKAVDGVGYTPLHGAALAVAKAARGGGRRRGAYGNSAAVLNLGNDDKSPLALEDALDVVRRLLAAGADPNLATVYPTAGPPGDVRINPAPPGSTPLHIAASSSSVALVRLLLDRGGDPNRLRKDGHSPFSVAVLAGDLAVVREMVARDAQFRTLFHPADKIPDPVEAITLPRRDQTALHLAALEGSPALIEYLVSLGLPLGAKNSMGETPWDVADRRERYQEAAARQNAEGDAERLAAIKRQTTTTDAIGRLVGPRLK
jgi:ankyrin repeat protein